MSRRHSFTNGNHVGSISANASCAIQVAEIWLTLASLTANIIPDVPGRQF